jgi:hypothetical protein
MSQSKQVGRQLPTSLRGARRPLARIAAFGVLPAVSLMSNLVVLPILSGRFGEAGWSSVILGQAIGAAASVICALAWPMEGPHLVSRARPAQRLAMYRSSVRQRTAAVAAASPVLVTVCLVAGPSMPVVCVLSAVGTALNALSPAWYFVGVSRPSRFLIAEGGPRLVVNLAGIGLVALLPLWSYPVALIVGMVATLAIASLLVHRDAGVGAPDSSSDGQPPPTPIGGRIPLLAVLARGADAGSSYLTGPLVALVAAPAYPVYAAVDRLSQSLVNVMSTATQGLTAWIGETADGVRPRRLAGAVLLAMILAGLAFIVFSFSAPLLLHYLFAGTVEVSPLIAFLTAAIVSGAFLLRSLSLILLVPQGLAGSAYRLLLVGAFVGLPSVGVAAASRGSTGALLAAAIVPWIIVAAQLTIGFARLYGRRPGQA